MDRRTRTNLDSSGRITWKEHADREQSRDEGMERAERKSACGDLSRAHMARLEEEMDPATRDETGATHGRDTGRERETKNDETPHDKGEK